MVLLAAIFGIYRMDIGKRLHLERELGRVAHNDEISGCLAPLGPPRPTLTPSLRVEVARATVRGSQKKGRRPRVSYASVEYGSPILATRWDLIGRSVTRQGWLHLAVVTSVQTRFQASG